MSQALDLAGFWIGRLLGPRSMGDFRQLNPEWYQNNTLGSLSLVIGAGKKY
ncbi:MAG: hypothetical protein ABSE48_07860 [Verrucomicrobiota bacterium]|jgi:hypothetical protein